MLEVSNSRLVVNIFITLTFIISESDYQERLELKSATDRTLGIGIMQTDSVVLVLTAATMMKVNIDVDNVLTFDSE